MIEIVEMHGPFGRVIYDAHVTHKRLPKPVPSDFTWRERMEVYLRAQEARDYDWTWMGDPQFLSALGRDTAKAGHKAGGLTPDEVAKMASHVTIVRLYQPGLRKEGFSPMSVGVAVCSKHDQFSRRVGRELALRRALGREGYHLLRQEGCQYIVREQFAEWLTKTVNS